MRLCAFEECCYLPPCNLRVRVISLHLLIEFIPAMKTVCPSFLQNF